MYMIDLYGFDKAVQFEKEINYKESKHHLQNGNFFIIMQIKIWCRPGASGLDYFS